MHFKHADMSAFQEVQVLTLSCYRKYKYINPATTLKICYYHINRNTFIQIHTYITHIIDEKKCLHTVFHCGSGVTLVVSNDIGIIQSSQLGILTLREVRKSRKCPCLLSGSIIKRFSTFFFTFFLEDTLFDAPWW